MKTITTTNLWCKIKSVKTSDYSNYEEGRSNNGGSYASFIETIFFQRGKEFAFIELHATTSEFTHSDCGSFCRSKQLKTLVSKDVFHKIEMTISGNEHEEDWQDVPLEFFPTFKKCTWDDVQAAENKTID